MIPKYDYILKIDKIREKMKLIEKKNEEEGKKRKAASEGINFYIYIDI
jgi:hypothetical protein